MGLTERQKRLSDNDLRAAAQELGHIIQVLGLGADERDERFLRETMPDAIREGLLCGATLAEAERERLELMSANAVHLEQALQAKSRVRELEEENGRLRVIADAAIVLDKSLEREEGWYPGIYDGQGALRTALTLLGRRGAP